MYHPKIQTHTDINADLYIYDNFEQYLATLILSSL
jgi:hypothetical protein